MSDTAPTSRRWWILAAGVLLVVGLVLRGSCRTAERDPSLAGEAEGEGRPSRRPQPGPDGAPPPARKLLPGGVAPRGAAGIAVRPSEPASEGPRPATGVGTRPVNVPISNQR